MRVVKKQKELTPDDLDLRRRMLATIHIALKDLGWSDQRYRRMLTTSFSVPTAAALTNEDLARIIQYFKKEFDWLPKGCKSTRTMSYQAQALQCRVFEFIPQLPGGEKRLLGLCRKLCGVDRVEWCTSEAKLKRLLAAMGNITRKEKEENC